MAVHCSLSSWCVSLGCPHLSGFRGYECTHTQASLQNVFSVAHAGSKAVYDTDTVRLSQQSDCFPVSAATVACAER